MSEWNADQWVEVKRLFERAAALPQSARAAFLERECPSLHVRQEIASLLEHTSGPSVASDAVAAAAAIAQETDPDQRLIGARLGAYRVTAIVGHGGMGAVYRAERDDAVPATGGHQAGARGGCFTRGLIAVPPGTSDSGAPRASQHSRPRCGRLQVAAEAQARIRRLAAENPDWAAPRIHGELLKLGVTLSERTVARYLLKSYGAAIPARPRRALHDAL